MVTCPSCGSAEGVQIASDPTGLQHWAGRCDACDHGWSFSDDLA